MLIFSNFNHIVTSDQRKHIINLLSSQLTHQINLYYNNQAHFGNPLANYDIQTFLNELKAVIDSKFHNIEIMGNIHSDFHTTFLLGQYNDLDEFIPAYVKDNYIRFKFNMHPTHFKIFHVLKPNTIYHFLTSVPNIEKLTIPKSPLFMRQPEPELIPTSNYKKMKIQFI